MPASPTGPARVGDHEHIRVERDLAAVEQRQALAALRHAHVDVPTELAQVVGVQRLAELQHHVVRDVHDRADRPQAGAAQALAHPERRARASDRCRGSTRPAKRGQARGRLEAHRELSRDARAATGSIVGRRQLACRRSPRPRARRRASTAVAAIRRDVELRIGSSSCSASRNRRAGHELGRQLEEAVLVVGEPELARRAQHARRFDAAQLRAPDRRARRAASRRRARAAPSCRRARSARRRRSAAALRRRPRPGRPQLVGVRMALDARAPRRPRRR